MYAFLPNPQDTHLQYALFFMFTIFSNSTPLYLPTIHHGRTITYSVVQFKINPYLVLHILFFRFNYLYKF